MQYNMVFFMFIIYYLIVHVVFDVYMINTNIYKI